MNGLARVSNQIGLLLSRREEREIVQSAALKTGLQPVDLAELPLAAGSRIPTEFKALQLVITDTELTGGVASLISPEDGPLVLAVRDAGQPDQPENQPENSDNNDKPEGWTQSPSGTQRQPPSRPWEQPVWVLSRPLQQEAVAGQLEKAAYASRVFASRQQIMLEQLQRAHRIFDSVGNGISISDASLPDLPLVYVNRAFERITGYSAAEAYGRNCRFLQGEATDQLDLIRMREAIHERREVRVLLKNYRKDGSPFWNELYLSPVVDPQGQLTHFIGIQNDVTAQVESAERIDHLATHDPLTGLANRVLLMDRLQQALLRARRRGGSVVAVLYFDLDHFKQVNSLLGHEAGDRLLQIVADRLRTETRANEMVARLGGDEFIAVLEDFSDDRRPHGAMQRLSAKLCEPVQLLGQEYRPSTSVGMALFPYHGDDPESLLKVADLNMYAAKHSGKLASQSSE